MLLCGSPGHQEYGKARACLLKNLTGQTELMRATEKEAGVGAREGTGSEEVRMLCGPPGTYKEAGCGAKARLKSQA